MSEARLSDHERAKLLLRLSLAEADYDRAFEAAVEKGTREAMNMSDHAGTQLKIARRIALKEFAAIMGWDMI